MVDKILVPLDGSLLAERALPIAAALARATGATVVLARAAFVQPVPLLDTTSEQVRELQEAESYLAQIAEQLARQGIVVVTTVPYGPVAEMIIAAARQTRANLVVMATHGRGGLGRWVYGSVAAAVLAGSPVPILLARAWHTATALTALGTAPRILVPLDGSRFAEEALPIARSLATSLGGSLLLMRAVPYPVPVDLHRATLLHYIAEELGQETTEASAYLHDIAARLPGEIVGQEVCAGAAAKMIASYGREQGAALVVMATHGHTGLERVRLGSVADAVLREGTIPLLLVRPSALVTGAKGCAP